MYRNDFLSSITNVLVVTLDIGAVTNNILEQYPNVLEINMKNFFVSFVLNQKLSILLLKIGLSLTYISRTIQEYDSSIHVDV